MARTMTGVTIATPRVIHLSTPRRVRNQYNDATVTTTPPISTTSNATAPSTPVKRMGTAAAATADTNAPRAHQRRPRSLESAKPDPLT